MGVAPSEKRANRGPECSALKALSSLARAYSISNGSLGQLRSRRRVRSAELPQWMLAFRVSPTVSDQETGSNGTHRRACRFDVDRRRESSQIQCEGNSMKRSRFSEREILALIQSYRSGSSVRDLCKLRGISVSTFYSWKLRFGCTGATELTSLQRLQRENLRLRKQIAGMYEKTDKLKGQIRKLRLLSPAGDLFVRATISSAQSGTERNDSHAQRIELDHGESDRSDAPSVAPTTIQILVPSGSSITEANARAPHSPVLDRGNRSRLQSERGVEDSSE